MDLSITLCNLWVKKTTWRFIMTEKPTNNGFVCLDIVPVAQTTLTFYATDRIELTSLLGFHYCSFCKQKDDIESQNIWHDPLVYC